MKRRGCFHWLTNLQLFLALVSMFLCCCMARTIIKDEAKKVEIRTKLDSGVVYFSELPYEDLKNRHH